MDFSTLSRELTSSHFKHHYERALQELKEEGTLPHARGVSDFAQCIFLSDIINRAESAGLPWDSVLVDVVRKVVKLAQQMELNGVLSPEIRSSIQEFLDDMGEEE